MCDFALHGVPLDVVIMVQDDLKKKFAEICEVDPDQVTLLIENVSYDDVIVKFVVDKPTQDVKGQCNSGEIPPQLRKLIDADKKLRMILPNQTGNIDYYIDCIYRVFQNCTTFNFFFLLSSLVR